MWAIEKQIDKTTNPHFTEDSKCDKDCHHEDTADNSQGKAVRK